MYKNVNTVSEILMDFPRTPVTPQHAVIIDDIIVVGRRLLRTYILLGRRVCKRVDVYVITLSCTWRIYALCERLLVLVCSVENLSVMWLPVAMTGAGRDTVIEAEVFKTMTGQRLRRWPVSACCACSYGSLAKFITSSLDYVRM